MVLLKDKKLNACILISLSCHLFCMIAVAPIIAGGNVRRFDIDAAFLGSILERISVAQYNPVLDEVPLIGKAGYDSHETGFGEPDIMPKVVPDFNKEGFFSLVKRIEKSMEAIKYKAEKSKIIGFSSDFTVKGDAENRLLLYRPDMSKIAYPLFSFESDCSVSLKFKVSRHGFVEQPECITSSGSSYIDDIAIRYIRKWQFVPDYNGPEEFQEGFVSLNFTNNTI